MLTVFREISFYSTCLSWMNFRISFIVIKADSLKTTASFTAVNGETVLWRNSFPTPEF